MYYSWDQHSIFVTSAGIVYLGAAGVSVQRRDRCTGIQFGSQLFLIFRCEI